MTKNLLNAILAANDAIHEAAAAVARVADHMENLPRSTTPNKKPAQPYTVAGINPALTFLAFGSADR